MKGKLFLRPPWDTANQKYFNHNGQLLVLSKKIEDQEYLPSSDGVENKLNLVRKVENFVQYSLHFFVTMIEISKLSFIKYICLK